MPGCLSTDARIFLVPSTLRETIFGDAPRATMAALRASAAGAEEEARERELALEVE
jgi:hypothetical protein